MAKKDLNNKVVELENENEKLKERIKQLTDDFEYLKKVYDNDMSQINFERFARLNYQYIKNHGILKFLWQILRCLWKIILVFKRKINRLIKRIKHSRELRKILKKYKGRKIFLFYPGYDWNMRMYQRPQHMAIHFAEKDVLFFYCTTNINDNIDGYEEVKDGLIVTNMYDSLKKHLPKYTLYMCANMNGCYLREIKKIINKNDVLYEYIDDLHEDLTSISKDLLDRHEYILKNENVKVVTTAQYLFDKAVKIRGSKKNIITSTNGVVYEDFHITKKLSVPSNIKNIVKQNKPIIGYYGALAKWFDYDLIEKMANKHKDWNILLIGIDYDKSFAKYNYFKDLKNVYYIGTVEYKSLINYGNCCSVLTIPFLINEITLSTSPVKVFEYMSMEKPIVTTDLPECRKYKSVFISKSHDEFIKNVEKGISMQNDLDYRKLLKKEALENTWDKKVDEILELLNK